MDHPCHTGPVFGKVGTGQEMRQGPPGPHLEAPVLPHHVGLHQRAYCEEACLRANACSMKRQFHLMILTVLERTVSTTQIACTMKRQLHLTILILLKRTGFTSNQLRIIKCQFHLTILILLKRTVFTSNQLRIIKWDRFQEEIRIQNLSFLQNYST